MCEIGVARHGLRGFGKATNVCVHVCMCVFVHVSACSNFSPTGPEVTAVRKQIDFYPPTHKQLTTWCSIRHTMHNSLPWPGSSIQPIALLYVCMHQRNGVIGAGEIKQKNCFCENEFFLVLIFAAFFRLCVPLWDEPRLSIMMATMCCLFINIIHTQLSNWTTSKVSKAEVQIWM